MHSGQSFWRRWVTGLWVMALAATLIPGCAPADAAANVATGAPTVEAASAAGLTPKAAVTEDGVEYRFPEDTNQPAPTAEPPPTPVPVAEYQTPLLWVDPTLPPNFISELALPGGLPTATDQTSANLRIEVFAAGQPEDSGKAESLWIYALVAPFPTVTDGVRGRSLQSAWAAGRGLKEAADQPFLMTAETLVVFEGVWGPAADGAVEIAESSDLLEMAWRSGQWAIIPFEEIAPRWKVIRVDGQSPLDRNFQPEEYALAYKIRLTAEDGVDAAVISAITTLPTNRDPGKLTTLVMTGVTALARHTGARMESKGVTYPARDIGSVLQAADLTHISNEVSFYSACPTPGPDRADMRFCSSPRYIELLEAVGTDIVELTGNHNLDWGAQPFLDTLAMYRERGWGVYGGGETLDAARSPLLLGYNGSRFAFLGCSPSGPQNVWATSNKPGSAPCDFNSLEAQVRDLRAAGYLPIVTLQAIETDTYLPAVAQGMPLFRRLARAGAVIVSGSQSHVPQTMTFVNSQGTDSFVHYGLGNLFFDQMRPLAVRQQFIDRHVFYDGRYLGVELITTLLEDYARPRPMTAAERESFLKTIFSLSDWSGPVP